MDYLKKLTGQSGCWYNDGLRRAQIRDMSGAVRSLRRSLQYDKENIEARNLLGLVYYGRGDVAEALVEWIISRNLKPKDNIAHKYIKKVQGAPKELETINQAVKKYNQCLVYCRHQGEDLAIIQLKKVVVMHPTFLKAHQLLALLFLKTGQYEKCRQELKEARKLDTANELTLLYIQELLKLRDQKVWKKEKKRAEAVEYRFGNETIIQPKHSPARELPGRFTFLNILTGILIGAAAIWFLVMPAADGAEAGRMNQQMIQYSQRIHVLEAQINALTRTLDDYRVEDADASAAAEQAAQVKESYENLTQAARMAQSEEYSDDTTADTLFLVNRDILDANGQALYDSLTQEVFPGACERKYAAGIQSLNIADYAAAVDHLSRVVRMDESYDYGGALLGLGRAYKGSGDTASAEGYFRRVTELFPETENAQAAQGELDSIAQAAAQDGGSGENQGGEAGTQ